MAEPPAATAAMFAALGDPTRLAMIERLATQGDRSIVALAAGRGLTRQAIAKHLQVMERAELVRRRRSGRESLYTLRRERVEAARGYLAEVAAHWDAALDRLKAHVENAHIA